MLAIGVIINNVGSAPTPDKAYPIHHFLDHIRSLFEFSDNKVQKVALLLLGVAFFKGFFLFFSRYTTRVLAIKISRDLRQGYFDHIQTLSMSFYQRYNIGSLSTRVVGDASQIAVSLNAWITNYLHTPFALISTLSICFYLSWKLSLIIFVGVPLIILPVRLITRRVKKITKNLQKNQEKFASVLIDFLAGIQTVKIFSMENFTSKKYQKQNDDMEFLETKTTRYDLMTRPILHFVTTFCLVVILFIGLYGMHIELAELIVFCGLLHLFYEPIRKFADENACVQRGICAAERLFEVLDIKPEIKDSEDAKELVTFHHEIEFKDVWFRYENEWVLKGVSFKIPKAKTVAICGSTGSGKSTILQLIPRLYEVERGDILIDQVSIKQYSQKSLRSLISFVPQKPFLFNDTIRDNILFGKDISDEELKIAAKKAYADEFIDELQSGYETHINDMGKNLSGGQQQRVAIARALAKKSPILILDEATSSLDAVSEQKIKNAIEGLHGEMTQIIVAHRLSTIEHADKIIFIEKGNLIAEGSKEYLLKNCIQFRAMWEASSLEKTEVEVYS
jgi:ABC-type multidrug transport system fused ATPase/permease subunit